MVAGADLVGRERELAVLRRIWQDACQGQARVVGVAGVSGIGKTALVRRFAGASGASAVWASGDEDEAGLAWSVLSQLTPAIAAGPGTADGFLAAQTDPVFVAHTLASWLRGSGAALLVIDDAQWADRQSMVAVRLAVRRLLTEPLLVIVIHQSPGDAAAVDTPRPPAELDDGWRRLLDSDRGARLELTGLPAADLVRLAVACGHPGLSPAGAARLHEHTGGHPLHVRHLLDELPMHSITFGHGALPAPRGIAAAVRSRLVACRPRTRDLVAAGSVLGRRFSLTQIRQLLGVDDVLAAAEDALRARLLEEVPGSMGQEVGFTSTLIRGMVYHELDPALRRALHLRAARAGGDGALWHRVAAADGPDGQLAEDLEQEAGERFAQGQLLRAAALLRHALDLTLPGPARDRRLLTALEVLLVVGDVAMATRYRGELAGRSGAWTDYVTGYLELLTGSVTGARDRLARALAAVRRGESTDGQPADLEARITTQLAVIGVLTLSYRDMIEHGTAAVAVAREPWVAAFACFARSIGLAIAGRATDALAELSAVDAPGAPSGLDGLVARGMIRLWTDDLTGARADLAAAVERAAGGETLRIGQALGFLGEVEYRRGALREAVVHTQLAVGDAEENNRTWDFALLHALASYPLAAMGDWTRARAHAASAATWARRTGAASGLAYAAASRAAIAAARGDAPALLAAAEDLELIYPANEPGTHLAGALRADALSRLGRADEAEDALRAFAGRLIRGERRSTQLAIARVRAQISAANGEHGPALSGCEQAALIAHAIGFPLEQAKIEVLAATSLAALGRRPGAERALRSALRRFTAAGASAYVTLTLLTAGDAGVELDTSAAALLALTPAERAVVALVCQDLSNRAIATRLVLSTKTVEFHLTNVFRKLDVRGRDELRRAVAETR